MTNKPLSLYTLETFISHKFFTKYYNDELCYGARVINDIMYNEKSRVVAAFKDFLILDDYSEFLKRYYSSSESAVRLPRFFEYYETYSRIYPNYTALPESKYIYKNIHKKQKMIDLQQEHEVSLERKKHKKKNKSKDNDNKVFSTEVYNSLQNDSSYLDRVFELDKVNNDQIAHFYERTNCVINEIDKYEIKQNDVHRKKQSKMFGKFIPSYLNGNNLVNANKNIFKNININIFNDIQLANHAIITGTHRRTLSTNSSKSKSYFNMDNISSSKLSTNIIPLTQNETDKIKVNLNSKRISKGKYIDKKNNDIHNRNHNCLLNNRGQIFNSQTNNTLQRCLKHNNSTRINTITNINHFSSQTIKNQLGAQTARLKTLRPRSEIDFEFLHNVIQKTLTKSKSGIKKEDKINSNMILNTVRNSSKIKKQLVGKLFNNKYMHKNFNSNKISRSNSKKVSVNVTGSGNSSLVKSKANSKPKHNQDKQLGISNNKSNKQVIKVQTLNKIQDLIFISPPKHSTIKGIHIKNFNKVKGLNEYFSPQLSSSDSNRNKKTTQPLKSMAFRKQLMK